MFCAAVAILVTSVTVFFAKTAARTLVVAKTLAFKAVFVPELTLSTTDGKSAITLARVKPDVFTKSSYKPSLVSTSVAVDSLYSAPAKALFTRVVIGVAIGVPPESIKPFGIDRESELISLLLDSSLAPGVALNVNEQVFVSFFSVALATDAKPSEPVFGMVPDSFSHV